MIQINQPKETTFSNNFIDRLLHKWFVKYNPLYFISALCFVCGVFFVSRGMHKIDWIDGQIVLTAAIESYEILLLVGIVFYLKARLNHQPCLYMGALLALHFSLSSFGRESLSFSDPPLYLAVSTGVGLLAPGWIYRLISAFLIVLVGVLVFWNPRGPQGIIEWGSLLIAK